MPLLMWHASLRQDQGHGNPFPVKILTDKINTLQRGYLTASTTLGPCSRGVGFLPRNYQHAAVTFDVLFLRLMGDLDVLVSSSRSGDRVFFEKYRSIA